jgi:mannose-6-phosphate isomerase
MQEEQVILVDINDREIGLCPKMEAHQKALLHRAFSVFIFNNEGKLLLQQRAAHKYHSPGLWTNTVCSHQRKGENNIEAGKRRLHEEMGLEADLKEVFHFIYKAELDQGLTEHELDHVLIGFSEQQPIINPDEVMDYRWESLENIYQDIQQNPDDYTEWFKIIFENSLEKLKNELELKMLEKPIKFHPIFKEKPWGGEKLKSVLNKNIPYKKIGESWEISNIPENISVVSEGYFKNKNLQELISNYKEKLLGNGNYQKYKQDFPLLIKFIDANDDLSIQVHPGDEMAQKLHQSFGKNELWQVLQADPESFLYIGFKENTSKEDYLQKLQEGKLEELLNKIEVKEGDTFYIPAGTVHAIGKGILIAEIQQSSDLTYRIFDWNRTGLDGKPRELHTQLALQAIDFKAQPQKIDKFPVTTPYFTIRRQHFTQSGNRDISSIDSFLILMNTGEGKFNIDGTKLNKGEVLLLPAIKENYWVEVKKPGSLLEVYL